MSIARKAFEAWYSDGGATPKAIEKIGDNYKYMGAHTAWTSWQAAYESAACFCATVGADWNHAGDMQKFYAAEYLSEQMRTTPNA